LKNEIEDAYDFVFWFDAGLSHNGLIPNKHLLRSSKDVFEHNYESKLFNDTFLRNLLSFCDNRMCVVAKNNEREFYWDGTVPQSYYTNYSRSRHIIGGFFGGKSSLVEKLCDLFDDYVIQLLDNESKLYSEEIIMSLIYYNHIELFNSLYFDLWWHENQVIPDIDDMKHYIKNKRSFYLILEDLNIRR
jgi:hypothetical protein